MSENFIKNIAENSYLNATGFCVPRVLDCTSDTESAIDADRVLFWKMGKRDYDKYGDDISDLCSAYNHQGFINGFMYAVRLMESEVEA